MSQASGEKGEKGQEREQGRKVQIGKLELSRETIQDLTEGEADAVKGGLVNQAGTGAGDIRCQVPIA